MLQAQALEGVADALVEVGEHARAEQIARSITNPDPHACALTDVANALAQASNPKRAVRLLGTALGVGDWTRLPLSAVADISPDVIRAIADATLSNREG